MFRKWLSRPNSDFRPLRPWEILKYIKLKRSYAKLQREPPMAKISDEEMSQLQELCRIAAEKSRRTATLLKLGEAAHEPQEQGSYLGYINTLPAEINWPEIDGEPMLPLLQLRLTDVDHRSEHLQGIAYLLVFCGIEAQPDMPDELFREFYEISQKRKAESLVRDFYERNGSRISTNYFPNPDQVRIFAIQSGRALKRVQSRDAHSILTPHAIEFQQVDDTIDMWDGRFLDFLSSADAEIANRLMDEYESTNAQWATIELIFENHKESKVGGWPHNIQSFIDFDDKADFMLQIASREELGLMLGDAGTVYIGYNSKKREWVSDWACY